MAIQQLCRLTHPLFSLKTDERASGLLNFSLKLTGQKLVIMQFKQKIALKVIDLFKIG